MSGQHPSGAPTTAFVLGGGGVLGSAEVGMLHALLERDTTPDLIVASSVGALNRVLLAADPKPEAVTCPCSVWDRSGGGDDAEQT